MTVFVDTSGIVSFLDRDDPSNPAATQALDALRGQPLRTHTYVVAETLAVVRRRLGPEGACRVLDELIPALSIEPVDGALHVEALTAYRASGVVGPSFVDRVSFAFMRREGIDTAFAVDRDFALAGYRVIP